MAVTTSNSPAEYDIGVKKTIPYYDEIHFSVLDLIAHAGIKVENWLDTGCGTGMLVRRALAHYPDAHYILADPSEEMLSVARSVMPEEANCEYRLTGSESLELAAGSCDVVTAILAHHYLDREGRERAVSNCYRALKPGGIFFTCEHTAPRSEQGLSLTLARWRDYQFNAGKTAEKADAHVARYGKSYFPISVREQIELLEKTGFSTVEVLWSSYCDVLYYAVKG